MKRAQKFKRGDLVHIVADLGASMAHFESDLDAVVMGSYADQFGGSDTSNYTVMFVTNGAEVSWYPEQSLIFKQHLSQHDIDQIISAKETRQARDSRLEWIAENWNGEPSGATCEALMRAIGIENPWGRNGEGYTWYVNWHATELVLLTALEARSLPVLRARIDEVRAALVR